MDERDGNEDHGTQPLAGHFQRPAPDPAPQGASSRDRGAQGHSQLVLRDGPQAGAEQPLPVVRDKGPDQQFAASGVPPCHHVGAEEGFVRAEHGRAAVQARSQFAG